MELSLWNDSQQAVPVPAGGLSGAPLGPGITTACRRMDMSGCNCRIRDRSGRYPASGSRDTVLAARLAEIRGAGSSLQRMDHVLRLHPVVELLGREIAEFERRFLEAEVLAVGFQRNLHRFFVPMFGLRAVTNISELSRCSLIGSFHLGGT